MTLGWPAWIKRPVRYLLDPLIGPPREFLGHLRRSPSPSVAAALESFEEQWERPAADDEEPVFIFSAGWRSGSTLLQRLVSSSGTILLWGEPYDQCHLVQSLARTLTAFRDDYPPAHFVAGGDGGHRGGRSTEEEALRNEWIANLYPDPEFLWRAHRSFFLSLLRRPAVESGYNRWGLKEVRLSAEHAQYLAWLFPRARFLFLIRNPYDAYRSYRPHRGWYQRWPDRPVLTPLQFGRQWFRLAKSFRDPPAGLRCLVLRFEELVSEEPPIGKLRRFLEADLSPEVLDKKVGTSSERRAYGLPFPERFLLRRAVEPLASELGYASGGGG